MILQHLWTGARLAPPKHQLVLLLLQQQLLLLVAIGPLGPRRPPSGASCDLALVVCGRCLRR